MANFGSQKLLDSQGERGSSLAQTAVELDLDSAIDLLGLDKK